MRHGFLDGRGAREKCACGVTGVASEREPEAEYAPQGWSEAGVSGEEERRAFDDVSGIGVLGGGVGLIYSPTFNELCYEIELT